MVGRTFVRLLSSCGHDNVAEREPGDGITSVTS